MMKKEKGSNIIGLAAKAGRTLIGKHQIGHAVRRNDEILVIIAKDAGKDITDFLEITCQKHQVDFIKWCTKKVLGSALGKNEISAVAITDQGLANKFIQNVRDLGF